LPFGELTSAKAFIIERILQLKGCPRVVLSRGKEEFSIGGDLLLKRVQSHGGFFISLLSHLVFASSSGSLLKGHFISDKQWSLAGDFRSQDQTPGFHNSGLAAHPNTSDTDK
jgi:hypothetical protein